MCEIDLFSLYQHSNKLGKKTKSAQRRPIQQLYYANRKISVGCMIFVCERPYFSFCWNGCCTLLKSNNSSAPARSFHLSEMLTDFPLSRQPVWVFLCSHQCESPAKILIVTPNHTPHLLWYRQHWFWSDPPPTLHAFGDLLSFLGQALKRRCECLKKCPKCCYGMTVVDLKNWKLSVEDSLR